MNDYRQYSQNGFYKQGGFSLIELLVVLFIIATLAAGVSLAINPEGSSAQQINQQGDRLFAQMNYALDEALISHRALGIVIDQEPDDLQASTKYSWYRFAGIDKDTRKKQWVPTEAPLGGHQLSQSLVWEVDIEDVSLEERLDELLSEDKEEIRPVIAFYPSGEVTAFSIRISLSESALESDPEARNEYYKIALSERGELSRYPVGEVDQ